MKEFSGTPGPWVARTGVGIDIIRDHDSAFGICTIGTHSQLCDADYPIEQAIANAKLIAAAPDLLNIVQRLKERYTDGQISEQDIKLMDEAINKALD